MKTNRHEFIGDTVGNMAVETYDALVLREFWRIDRLLVVLLNDKVYRIGCEVELSEKHCIVNCIRDLQVLDCHGVLSVCVDSTVCARVKAKFDKYLSSSMMSRVRVCEFADLGQLFAEHWIESLVNRDACLSQPRTSIKQREVSDER